MSEVFELELVQLIICIVVAFDPAFFHLPVPFPCLASDSNHRFLFPKERLSFENLSLVSLLEFASVFFFLENRRRRHF